MLLQTKLTLATTDVAEDSLSQKILAVQGCHKVACANSRVRTRCKHLQLPHCLKCCDVVRVEGQMAKARKLASRFRSLSQHRKICSLAKVHAMQRAHVNDLSIEAARLLFV